MITRSSLLLAFGAAVAVPAVARAQAPDGQELYQLNCKKCHGVLGVPPKAIQKKMSKVVTFDSTFATKFPEDSIVKILTKGGKSEDMKSFKDKLSPTEMVAVAKYVRQIAMRPKPAGTGAP
jgi:mono/diheme cytochrome c family protein